MKAGSMVPYILIYLLSVFLSSASQIVLKKEAVREHKSFLHEYLNVSVIVSYGIFFGCTLLTTFAYRGLPMSYGSVLETAGYLSVTALGAIFLKERITVKKLLALAVSMIGIAVYFL